MKDKKKIIRELFLAYYGLRYIMTSSRYYGSVGPCMIMGSYHENSHPICALPYVVFLYHMKISFRFEWVSFHFIPVQEKSQGEENYPVFFQYEACFFAFQSSRPQTQPCLFPPLREKFASHHMRQNN